jgi:hypothetical protein
MEVSGQLHARQLYLQGNSPWYPLDKRLGGLQSRSGRGGEEKNSQPLPGLETPIIQPVAHRYNTELSRLYNQYWRGKIIKVKSFIEKCYFFENREVIVYHYPPMWDNGTQECFD